MVLGPLWQAEAAVPLTQHPPVLPVLLPIRPDMIEKGNIKRCTFGSIRLIQIKGLNWIPCRPQFNLVTFILNYGKGRCNWIRSIQWLNYPGGTHIHV